MESRPYLLFNCEDLGGRRPVVVSQQGKLFRPRITDEPHPRKHQFHARSVREAVAEQPTAVLRSNRAFIEAHCLGILAKGERESEGRIVRLEGSCIAHDEEQAGEQDRVCIRECTEDIEKSGEMFSTTEQER